ENCGIAVIGFEFDSGKGKCVKKTGSCKVKTPFNTLEECQEVCEKNIDTSDWQIYRNEEFGYEIKYFKNMVEIFPDSVFERGSKGNPSFRIKSGGHFAFGVWENTEKLSFKEWLEKNNAMGATYDVQDVMIGNHKGYSALNLYSLCHIEWRGIEKENKFYTFGLEICKDDKDISLKSFNQILSTFKFIEK
ncbi:MAG: hypothetical protein U9P70_00460, partial [Patescibacteria group bacterium]|nr:hypothetical protein [Patescibacteria group bacterium]